MAAAFSTPVAAQPPGLVVSVAASVYDALDEIAGLYRATTGVTVALNAGGSNTLARQIVEGARAGLFISADDRQMEPSRRRAALWPALARACSPMSGGHRAAIASADSRSARVLEGRMTRLAMGEPARGARRRLRAQVARASRRVAAAESKSFRSRP